MRLLKALTMCVVKITELTCDLFDTELDFVIFMSNAILLNLSLLENVFLILKFG